VEDVRDLTAKRSGGEDCLEGCNDLKKKKAHEVGSPARTRQEFQERSLEQQSPVAMRPRVRKGQSLRIVLPLHASTPETPAGSRYLGVRGQERRDPEQIPRFRATHSILAQVRGAEHGENLLSIPREGMHKVKKGGLTVGKVQKRRWKVCLFSGRT